MLEKSNIALICIFVMFAGFLVSRVALSISMFVFGINAIRDVPPRYWVRNKWWLLGVCWVALYAVTWFWCDDKHNWDIRWQTKFPFLLLPLAFPYAPRFSAKQLQTLTIGIAILLLVSAFYSIAFFVHDPQHYIKGYRYSELLPTLPKEDHVRVSITMALFIIWVGYVWPYLHTGARWFAGISAGILAVYIHLLAAKSGLISLYLFLGVYGLYLAFAKKSLVGIIAICAIPVLFTIGIRYVPTFRERANYMAYSYFMFQHGDATGRYGDINRLYSYNIALMLIRQHPLIGVGTGDMLTEMHKGYVAIYPDVPENATLLPHNQFLVVALGCGIPAMILFIIWVFMPLAQLRKNRQSLFFFIVWLILFLQLMIEPVLEVQLGVFVFLFFLLLQKEELKRMDEVAN